MCAKLKDMTTTEEPDLREKEDHLRKRILEIHHTPGLEPKEKARKIQEMMQHPMTRPVSQKSQKETLLVSTTAIGRSYHDNDMNILGCSHYQRKVKILANCCDRLFPCRQCHDELSDHDLKSSDTKTMLCMECLSLQPVGQWCNVCGTKTAKYYCSKCQFWDDSNNAIYHCDDCGICRHGQGLGIDFFHCEKCNVCMSIGMKQVHKCLENNLQCDCPICGDYMFTSTNRVILMHCGHAIHLSCYQQHRKHSYQCPICLKSLGDMSLYFEYLQKELDHQPMPQAYASHTSSVFCNDCEQRSLAPYHFFYHPCKHCKSFNTTVLKTHASDRH
ncbi:zf-CHY-domain-containing protein, partial [Hesseltinella vesiculosa]